jgi:PAS domain S-box-containing protein
MAEFFMNASFRAADSPSGQVPVEDLDRSTSSVRWLVVALVCLLGLLVYIVYVQYREAVAEATTTTRNLVGVIESHVSNDFSRIDGVLTYIASRVSAADLQASASPAMQAVQGKRLADLKASFPIIDGLFIFDAEGTLRYSSSQNSKPISIADRPHFQQVRDNPEAQVAFSDAEITRTTGRWSIAQLRALRDERGRFLGTVNALIALERFGEAFDDIDVGPGGITLLRRTDTSRLTLRMPRNNEKDFNQPLPPNNPIRQRIEAGERTGTLTLTASVDGVKRLASFKRLDNAPFYAQVALAKDHYLAGWRREASGIAGVALLLLFGFGYVIWKLQKDAATVKAANTAQRDAVQRFAILVAASPSGIWQTDTQGACTFVSAQWSEIAGISADTALNHGWASGLHPDDRERIHTEWVETARKGAHKYLSEFRFAHLDGRIIWVHSQAVAETDAAGHVIGWVGTITDITDRKVIEHELRQEQQRLSNILWGTGVGTWEWNVQTGETRFNERWAEIIGYQLDELSPVSIETWMRLAHPDDLGQSKELLAGHFSGEVDHYECEARMRHKDGYWIWVLDRGKVVSRTLDGQPEWMAGTHWEITERKQVEEALHQKTADLAKSNSDLEQFAYVASHDLRQPLRMVNSYVQMLERRLTDKLDDETREMMHFATDGAKRMDQMLVSLLEYSRVGRKGEPLAMLASRSAVDEALQFLAPVISEAHAKVRVSRDWPEILASRDEFTRLWQNLIGNAVKYRAPDRAPEIDITVTLDTDVWRFSVADNGIGIEPAQFDRLFKVFQRLHTREQYEGTGIGLAVARKIVERHGGRIWVESEGAGLGCRFCFSLPAQTLGAK